MEDFGAPNICKPGSKNRACVKKFCGGQWDGCEDEEALDPGVTVEEPGFGSCKDAHGGDTTKCELCCRERALDWDHRIGVNGLTQEFFDFFVGTCKRMCNDKNPNCPAEGQSCFSCCTEHNQTMSEVAACESRCTSE